MFQNLVKIIQQEYVTSCMIKLPKDSPETQFAIGLQREHKKLILNGTITWSSGPKTVDLMVNKFGLQRYVVPWNTICFVSVITLKV